MHLPYRDERQKYIIYKFKQFYYLFTHGGRKNRTAQILCTELGRSLGPNGREVLDQHNIVLGYEVYSFPKFSDGLPYSAKFKKLKAGPFLADNHPIVNRGAYRYNPEKRIKYEEQPGRNPQNFRIVLLDGRLMTIKKSEQKAIFKELVDVYRKQYHDKTNYFIPF